MALSVLVKKESKRRRRLRLDSLEKLRWVAVGVSLTMRKLRCITVRVLLVLEKEIHFLRNLTYPFAVPTLSTSCA